MDWGGGGATGAFAFCGGHKFSFVHLVRIQHYFVGYVPPVVTPLVCEGCMQLEVNCDTYNLSYYS